MPRDTSSTATDTTDAKRAAPASPASAGLFTDPDGTTRCAWCEATPLYRHYHDSEWAFPVADERRLFEKICLEGFQAGLSWLTILNKRESFRSAFANFEAEQVARFDASDTQRLLADASIVRHAGKIASTINNAQRMLELRLEFGSLGAFVWRLDALCADRPEPITHSSVRATPASPASVLLSKELKKRGWTFVGPTTMHAFMQAMGVVNDHLEGCASRAAALAARAAFTPPQAVPARINH
jgi:DNA-3-methyladenine glycosylase I